MAILLANDTISGQEGIATINLNGRIEEAFYLKDLEATAEFNKEPVRTIGKRGEQQKISGWTGEGTMTIFYITSLFREIMLDYIKKGVTHRFTLTVTNEDPDSSAGKQTIIFQNCLLDSVVMAKLDVESNSLDEEVSFTYDDIDMPNKFNKPSNM